MAAGAGAGAAAAVGGATYLSEYHNTTVENTETNNINVNEGEDGQYGYEGNGEYGENGYEGEYYEVEYYEGDEHAGEYADATSASYDPSFADQQQQPQISSSGPEIQASKEGYGESGVGHNADRADGEKESGCCGCEGCGSCECCECCECCTVM